MYAEYPVALDLKNVTRGANGEEATDEELNTSPNRKL